MATVSKEFITAGKAIFTLEVPSEFARKHDLPPHYTYRVKFKKGSGNFNDAFFIQLLTGPENTSDYTYLGMLDDATGNIKLTRKSAYGEDSMVVKLLRRALARVWKGEQTELEVHGFKLHHEGRCGRCGRLLTVPESIETGIGPECRLKMLPGEYGSFKEWLEDQEPDPSLEAEDRALAGLGSPNIYPFK